LWWVEEGFHKGCIVFFSKPITLTKKIDKNGLKLAKMPPCAFKS
jgi:hypothetical protein